MRNAVREIGTTVLTAIFIFAAIVTAVGAVERGATAGAARPSTFLMQPSPDPHP